MKMVGDHNLPLFARALPAAVMVMASFGTRAELPDLFHLYELRPVQIVDGPHRLPIDWSFLDIPREPHRWAADGFSVALEGDIAVSAGANPYFGLYADAGFMSAGIYIYQRDYPQAGAWGLRRLHGSDELHDRPAPAISLSSNRLAMGGFGSFPGNGFIDILERNWDGPDQWGVRWTLMSDDYWAFPNTGFGHALALDGDRLAVAGRQGASTGVVHVLELSGSIWTNRKTIVLNQPATNMTGIALSLQGARLMVGLPDAVQVQLFEQNAGGANNWGLTRTITPSDPAAGSRFGHTVHLSGDDIAVGAPQRTEAGAVGDGAAYVFHRNQGGADQWGQVRKVVSPHPGAQRKFGNAVRLSGNRLAVGEPAADGKVHVFGRNTGGANQWGWEGTAHAHQGDVSDLLGFAVALDGDRLLAGAPTHGSVWSAFTGAAFLFGRNIGGTNQWGREKLLFHEMDITNGFFGTSVAVYGDVAVAGITGGRDFFEPNRHGCAFVYHRDVWPENGFDVWPLRYMIMPPYDTLIDTTAGWDPEVPVEFGASVAVYEGRIAVSAPAAVFTNIPSQGAVTIYDDPDFGLQAQPLHTIVNTNASVKGFGRSLAFGATNLLFVGAPQSDLPSFPEIGLVMVYSYTGPDPWPWNIINSYTPLDEAVGTRFGAALHADPATSTLIVGAPDHAEVVFGGGRAYAIMYDYEGAAILSPPDPSVFKQYGSSVAVQGNWAAVGAPFDSSDVPFGGSVYMHNRFVGGFDEWGFSKKIVPADIGGTNLFGSSVALEGDRLLVGAPGQEAGVVYEFRRNHGGANNWGQWAKHTAPGVGGQALFGSAVGLHDDVMIAGAPLHAVKGRARHGSAHLYRAPLARITKQNRSGNDMLLRFQVTPGLDYRVQATTNLIDPASWTDFGPVFNPVHHFWDRVLTNGIPATPNYRAFRLQTALE